MADLKQREKYNDLLSVCRALCFQVRFQSCPNWNEVQLKRPEHLFRWMQRKMMNFKVCKVISHIIFFIFNNVHKYHKSDFTTTTRIY